MLQGTLFEEPPAPWPPCAHGTPMNEECAGCIAAVEEGCRQFDLEVAAGKYNTLGYTPAEWKHAGYDPAAWAAADRSRRREKPGC